jgi:hypothetical protein
MAPLPDPSETLASFAKSNAVQLELRRQYRLTKFSVHKEKIYFDWQWDPIWLSWIPTQTVYYHFARSMCNKLTCVYWSYSSHNGDSNHPSPPGPCAAAWTEWHRHCDIDRLEYGFYFGKCFKMLQDAERSSDEPTRAFGYTEEECAVLLTKPCYMQKKDQDQKEDCEPKP